MSVFDTAVQALFRDPNITEGALWRPGGVGAGIAIRIIRTRPQAEFDIGGVKLLQDPFLFDVPGRIWRVDVRRM